MSQYMTMTSLMTLQDEQLSCIALLHRQTGCCGANVGRGCSCGCGGCGCGRGLGGHGGRHRERGSRGYNPYSISQGGYNSFKAEARSYLPEEWDRLSSQKKEAVVKSKQEAGWINSYTPPEGFTLDGNGRPTPSTLLVAAIQLVIGQVNECSNVPSILPPT